MDSIEREDNFKYIVVVNHEEQYSIWRADFELPGGWSSCGFEGYRDECIAYVDKVWLDMRPLSVRRALQEIEKNTQSAQPQQGHEAPPREPLVSRLTKEKRRFEFVSANELSRDLIKQSIKRGVVHFRIPDTDGGTVIGLVIDEAKAKECVASIDAGCEELSIVGRFTLDYMNAVCKLSANLSSFDGQCQIDLVS